MAEYKCKDGMIDNRMVRDSHQEGIKRVMQRGKEDRIGHNGKMGMDGMGRRKDSFKRSGEPLTPRRA